MTTRFKTVHATFYDARQEIYVACFGLDVTVCPHDYRDFIADSTFDCTGAPGEQLYAIIACYDSQDKKRNLHVTITRESDSYRLAIILI